MPYFNLSLPPLYMELTWTRKATGVQQGDSPRGWIQSLETEFEDGSPYGRTRLLETKFNSITVHVAGQD